MLQHHIFQLTHTNRKTCSRLYSQLQHNSSCIMLNCLVSSGSIAKNTPIDTKLKFDKMNIVVEM